MVREANPCGKARKIEEPYEIWRTADWEWRVLKKYQGPANEARNPYARWFCAVKSPYTHGAYEFGDVYCHEVKGVATKVEM